MPYTVGFGNYSTIETFKIVESTNKPDIFFSNLESPISLRNGNKIPFSGNPRILDIFKDLGINIVTIANNHILEQGHEGFLETIKLLKENNIKVIGINENNSSNIETFIIGNQTIAFAAFNAIHDITNPSLYAELSEERIEIALKNMQNANATFKILSFHWGNEYISLPSPEQIKIARFAVEKGCDLIIGHHPHVVQRVEIINNCYVFYSLGNAYFDYLFAAKIKKGLRVDCVLTKDKLNINYHFISSKYIGFKKIHEKTTNLLLSKNEIKYQNNESYEVRYYKKLKRIRFLFRLKMKCFLLELLFSLPFSDKLKLIKNTVEILVSKRIIKASLFK